MPENVTLEPSEAASAGPTPRTRSNPASDPKGPFAARSSMMRRARTGPMRGSVSISCSEATSRSTARIEPGDELRVGSETRSARSRCDALDESIVTRFATFPLRRLRPPPPFVEPDADARAVASRAESTAASCRDNAGRVLSSAVASWRAARTTRTLAPRTMTPARNRRALRSAGVGMAPTCHSAQPVASSVYCDQSRIIAVVPHPHVGRVCLEPMRRMSAHVHQSIPPLCPPCAEGPSAKRDADATALPDTWQVRQTVTPVRPRSSVHRAEHHS